MGLFPKDQEFGHTLLGRRCVIVTQNRGKGVQKYDNFADIIQVTLIVNFLAN